MTIELNNISKSFGPQLVVNDVSLQIKDGELFVLLGSSGSGKSTILRLIAGLADPDHGQILLHNRNVTHLAPQYRGTGFVFQNYAIFKHMSVIKNVEFGLRIRGVKAAERHSRSKRLLELVGLGGFDTRMPSQLSGGQRQRVALARALAYEPAVLLLDEPFSALDMHIRTQLRQTLREIQKNLKVTAIFVTHDQEEAYELGDRIGILEGGRLVEVNTPQNLYHKPKHQFSAGFLGGGNVIVGKTESGKIRLGSALIPFPTDSIEHEEGSPVRIVFRPETVHYQPEPFSDNDNIISLGEGIINKSTFIGAWKHLKFTLKSLRGSRMLMPAPTYGQKYPIIDVIEKSSYQSETEKDFAGENYWVGLSSYHVLEPTGLRFLMPILKSTRNDKAFELITALTAASHGLSKIISVTKDSKKKGTLTPPIEKYRDKIPHSLSEHFKYGFRKGKTDIQILKEIQEGYFDLLILGPPKSSESYLRGEVNQLIKRSLFYAKCPVLIAGENTDGIKRILICTAGGEPGKRDVKFTGRLARHLNSSATIFHVIKEDEQTSDKVITSNLQSAKAVLDTYNILSDIKIVKGNVSTEILKEAHDGAYDLVAIGAPLDTLPSSQELMIQLALKLKCAFAIIP